MIRSFAISLLLSFLVHAALSLGLAHLASWLGNAGLGRVAGMSMIIPTELLPYVPPLAAGLVAGLCAGASGSRSALLAVFAAELLLFNLNYGFPDMTDNPGNIIGLTTHCVAVALVAAVAARAGESRRDRRYLFRGAGH